VAAPRLAHFSPLAQVVAAGISEQPLQHSNVGPCKANVHKDATVAQEGCACFACLSAAPRHHKVLRVVQGGVHCAGLHEAQASVKSHDCEA